MWFFALFNLSASMHFIVEGMVFLLFPPMRELAPVFMLTTVCIRLDEILSLPLRALLFLVVKYMRFSPKILPIVSVNTSISGMVGVTVRAPNSLEVEHVKVRVLLEFVKQIYSHFFLCMREGAHISVVTRLNLVWV